ncbi:hypothetical protein [Demequina gelatinilytica]|uniref:hypothetical protein n=1 Tax=Demequina gelatinilytica TaxID=1638980 RepID=UPI000780C79F|nr:hypothetical protein [Demequina gelatinilytica]
MPTTPAAPEVGARARRAVRWSLVLFAAMLLVPMLGTLWGYSTLLLAPACATAMIIALVGLRGVQLTALKTMLWIGLGVSGLALLSGVGLVILHEQIVALVQCQDRAITHTAEQACLDEYLDSSAAMFERWGLSVPEQLRP